MKESTKEYIKGGLITAKACAIVLVTNNSHSIGRKMDAQKASKCFENAKELRKLGM